MSLQTAESVQVPNARDIPMRARVLQGSFSLVSFLRRMLSLERPRPIDAVIEAGVVPRLVSLRNLVHLDL